MRDERLREAGDFCYLARLHEWMEEYEEAEAVLNQAQSLYPEYWEIPFQRAAFHVRAGDCSGAVEYAELATQLAPWKTQTWKLLGRSMTASEGRFRRRARTPGPEKLSEFESNSPARLISPNSPVS